MGKGKLWKWEENAEMDNVFEPDLQEAVKGADHPYRGKWRTPQARGTRLIRSL